MNLILRMVRVLLMARRRARVGALDETSLTFRVWPNDVDVLMHMNNGRYLTLMDLGRADGIIRSGVHAILKEHDWYAVVLPLNYLLNCLLNANAKFTCPPVFLEPRHQYNKY